MHRGARATCGPLCELCAYSAVRAHTFCAYDTVICTWGAQGGTRGRSGGALGWGEGCWFAEAAADRSPTDWGPERQTCTLTALGAEARGSGRESFLLFQLLASAGHLGLWLHRSGHRLCPTWLFLCLCFHIAPPPSFSYKDAIIGFRAPPTPA